MWHHESYAGGTKESVLIHHGVPSPDRPGVKDLPSFASFNLGRLGYSYILGIIMVALCTR